MGVSWDVELYGELLKIGGGKERWVLNSWSSGYILVVSEMRVTLHLQLCHCKSASICSNNDNSVWSLLFYIAFRISEWRHISTRRVGQLKRRRPKKKGSSLLLHFTRGRRNYLCPLLRRSYFLFVLAFKGHLLEASAELAALLQFKWVHMWLHF